MELYYVKRPKGDVIVSIMYNRSDGKYHFVDLTKNHICACGFDSAEIAISDMESQKIDSVITDFYKIENERLSGDLISKDKLLYDFRHTITENSDTFDWLNMISRQPVAFNVDKVIEKIELLQDNICNDRLCTSDEKDAYCDACQRIIEIVKGGGLNE